MKLSKVSAALILAGAAVVPVQQASAEAVASAVIKLTNFQVFGGNATTGALTLLDVSQFSTFSFESTADASADLGSQSESVALVSDSNSDGIDLPTIAPGGVFTPNNNNLCVGDCTGAVGPGANDNLFPKLIAGDVLGNGGYAWADQEEKGAPISGLTNSLGGPVASSADVANASYAKVENGTGGSNSNNGLNTRFSFALNQDQDFLEFRFDVDSFAYAFLSPGKTGLASASTSVFFDIEDIGGSSLNFCNETAVVLPGPPPLTQCDLAIATPNISLGDVTSRQNGDDGPGTSQSAGSFAFRTLSGFDAGDIHQLTARLNANVEVELVPVPHTIALLGAGFGLLGFFARRRRVAA